jgi:hypothetical protein
MSDPQKIRTALDAAARAATKAGIQTAHMTFGAGDTVVFNQPDGSAATGIILHISQAPRYLAGWVKYCGPVAGGGSPTWQNLLGRMSALAEVIPEDWR